jgi:hypothetical protein
MRRAGTDRSSSFPYGVAWASLCIALLLFFFNTAPAVTERASLRALHAELLELRQKYDEAILQTRLGRAANSEHDLQGLLVAIDRLGMTPAELCAAHPEPVDSPPDDQTTVAENR